MSLEEKLAIIGYGMYYRNYTKEQLDNMNGIEILMLRDEFEKWLKTEKQRETRKN